MFIFIKYLNNEYYILRLLNIFLFIIVNMLLALNIWSFMNYSDFNGIDVIVYFTTRFGLIEATYRDDPSFEMAMSCGT